MKFSVENFQEKCKCNSNAEQRKGACNSRKSHKSPCMKYGEKFEKFNSEFAKMGILKTWRKLEKISLGSAKTPI